MGAEGGAAEPFFNEEQFERVCTRLRHERRIHNEQRERECWFLEAVYWVGRSGAHWRFLVAAYGGWNSVYKAFARWNDLDGWEWLLDGAAAHPDPRSVMLDRGITRARLRGWRTQKTRPVEAAGKAAVPEGLFSGTLKRELRVLRTGHRVGRREAGSHGVRGGRREDGRADTTVHDGTGQGPHAVAGGGILAKAVLRAGSRPAGR